MSSRTATSGLVVALIAGLVISACVAQPRIVLTPSPHVYVVRGDSTRLFHHVMDIADTSVTYTSANPSVATVSPSGRIQGTGVGTTTITVQSTVRPSVTTPVVVTVMPPLNVNQLINEVCPNQDSSYFTANAPISAALTYVHEFHDCQRLIADNTYRALIGIFADSSVNLGETAFADGRLAAVIVNFRTKGDTIPYGDLDLRPGTNCLFLNWNGHQLWEAAIVHQKLPLSPTSPRYEDCPRTLKWSDIPNDRKGILVVQLQTAVSPIGTKDVPPVARWDWDSNRGRNYIGIRCGRVWCEIGRRGFAPSTALKTENGQDIIKGYYDEQYLADARGNLSRVFGTVRPGRDGRVPGRMRRDGQWYRAAIIQTYIRPLDYSLDRSAFEFYVKEFLLKPNQPPQHTAVGDLQIMGSPESASDDYELKINNRSETDWTMKFHPHPGSENRTGTVRWRWREKDESVWSYCEPAGCCESQTAFQ
jgi:Big-like domain-containing protein